MPRTNSRVLARPVAALAAAGTGLALLTACGSAPGEASARIPSTPFHATPVAATAPLVAPAASTASTASARAGKVRAYGDSVMLGASYVLRHRLHAKVDAAVSRQSWSVLGLVRKAARAGKIHGPVVIHTGTNGTVERRLLVRTARAVRTEVVLVTVKAPRSWVAGVNSILRSVAAARGDVVLFDWNAYSRGHSSWFAGDGIHLTSSGAAGYVRGIRATLGR